MKEDARTSAIPVLMLTAMTQQQDVEEGLAAGADAYIAKPFSPSSLLEKIAQATKGSFSVGEAVRLGDGRIGKIDRRVILHRKGSDEVGYHVAVEMGGTATVSAEEVSPL